MPNDVLPTHDETIPNRADLDASEPTPARPAPAASAAERTDYELAREIVAFEKQFPPPEQDRISADAGWFEAQWGTETFVPYRGSFVAVIDQTVVGSGRNALQLQLDTAKRLNVHPQRFLVEYIPNPGFE